MLNKLCTETMLYNLYIPIAFVAVLLLLLLLLWHLSHFAVRFIAAKLVFSLG